MTRQCSDCGTRISRNNARRCKPCHLKTRKPAAPDRFCSVCDKLLMARTTAATTGLCGSCLNKRRGKDKAFQARRTAAIRAKFRDDPAHKAKMTRTILANASRARRDPEYRQRLSEHGKWIAAHVLQRPDVIAKSMAARAQAGRARSATCIAWCPEEYRDEYRFLTKTKRLLAAEARRIILAKLTPFERQMFAVKNGAGLIERPVARPREYGFTLGGVTDWSV